MGLWDRPSDKPVSLLMPTGKPADVGQASGGEAEDLPPGEGPVLVLLEGAGRPADAPVAEGQADQLGGPEDEVQEAGEIKGNADKPEV
jgi:hypothetical protein